MGFQDLKYHTFTMILSFLSLMESIMLIWYVYMYLLVCILMSIVCKGGSWASSGTIPSRFNRTWMRRHFFQHMGFRLVKSFNAAPVRLCRSDMYSVQGQRTEEYPILLTHVDLNHSVYPSCNSQFNYETKQALENHLQPFKVDSMQQHIINDHMFHINPIPCSLLYPHFFCGFFNVVNFKSLYLKNTYIELFVCSFPLVYN